MQREQPRAHDVVHVEVVERVVELEEAIGIADPARFGGQFRVDLTELRRDVATLCGWKERGGSRGEAFEVADDEHDFAPVVHGERGDDEPAFTSLPAGGDEPFLFEPVQCAPDGGTAESKTRGDDALGDGRPGGQLPTDNDEPERLVRACDVVDLVVGLHSSADGTALGRRGDSADYGWCHWRER